MGPEIKKRLKSYGIAAIIGTLIGFSLNFAALSPLIIGGIISLVSTYSFLILITSREDSLKHYEKTSQTKLIAYFLCTLATTAAVGIGLGAAIGTIFPAVMLNIESAALMSATIGVIAPVVSLFALGLLALTAEKINECIIEPTVEKIKECFSSKEA
ncbi:hypothetical protein JR053_03075 [Wolbachia endosymbiont of Nasonia vitripennis]|uniref:hypothetical protein n=1 Tax=unclassified Wolbachia TaxID=2640676 RepID=UPI003A8752B6